MNDQVSKKEISLADSIFVFLLFDGALGDGGFIWAEHIFRHPKHPKFNPGEHCAGFSPGPCVGALAAAYAFNVRAAGQRTAAHI